MHIYLYDQAVSSNSFTKIIARIETRLTDLGLNGKIIRLGITHSIDDTIDTEVKKGASTIVVVGDAKLFSRALNTLAKLNSTDQGFKKTPLGFIPTEKNIFTKYLGLDLNEAACNILAARRIEKFYLGEADKNVFLTQARINTDQTRLEIDESYTVEIVEKGDVVIKNLPYANDDKINPDQTKLAIAIRTFKSKTILPFGKNIANQSLINFNKLIISNKKHNLILDESLTIPTPVMISSNRKKIYLIIGKGRTE
jgi:hypothetical protein